MVRGRELLGPLRRDPRRPDLACRWDRHPKPGAPDAHLHPPPDADEAVEPSDLDATHHLGVLFAVLDRVADRVESLYGE